jgi:hypothetical protein
MLAHGVATICCTIVEDVPQVLCQMLHVTFASSAKNQHQKNKEEAVSVRQM